MSRVFALTLFLYKSFVKQRAITLFIILSIVSIAISIGVSHIDMGDGNSRLFRDVTISIQGSLLHLIAIFSLFSYLGKERNGGIFIFPLSSSLNRGLYFLSVVLSQIATILSLFILFMVVDQIYMAIYKVDVKIAYQLSLSILSSTVLILLFLALAQFTTALKAMIYSLTIFFFGNGLDELYIYAYKIKNDLQLQTIYDYLSIVVPNFHIFDQDELSRSNWLHILIQSIFLYILGYIKFRVHLLRVEN